MKRKDNELAAVVYADLFGYPLTVSEAKLWAIRKTRAENSNSKLELAKKVSGQLSKISFIQGIFLTGSVAVGNAKADADIDLIIVTAPGALWLTRLVVFLLLKKKHLYKSIICPNIFLDTNNLEIKEKNLYTAHEVLQAKCLFDRNNINYLWLVKNKWAREFLPVAYKSKIKNKISKIQSKNQKYLFLFEILAFILQRLYMRSKITNERVGWGFAFFHPRNLSLSVLKEFNKRIRDESDN